MSTNNHLPLLPHHLRELASCSAIAEDVIAERGYRTLSRDSNASRESVNELRRHGLPRCAYDEPTRFPGLLIPLYRPTGELTSWNFKPGTPPKDPKTGKYRKYLAVKGRASVIDVHPRNVAAMTDPTVPLWTPEGVKKADSLTSVGLVAAALAGVDNWRSRHASLGDWEDIALKGRDVYIPFDSDAATNANVLRAMLRYGRWLRSKGATPWYLICPTVDGLGGKVGVDDFLAAGGTVEQLRAAATRTEPDPGATDDTFTDSRLSETVADEVLDGSFVWCKALGWMAWDGRRWRDTTEETVLEAVRLFVLDKHTEAVASMATNRGGAAKTAAEGWWKVLSAGRQRAVLTQARGIAGIHHTAEEFDADPDLLNTPTGVVHLTTGEVTAHDPSLLMTRITRGAYRPGCTHPDWDQALEALPAAERGWFQARIGQAISGHTTPDGVLPLLQGSGENGKSLLTTDGVVPALGDYAGTASAKLLTAFKGSSTDHSTEMADLRGQRLVIAEEMTEGRTLDVTTIKRIQDVGIIKARYVHRDNMQFAASHSLFATTNYVPSVAETDHGVWRRLALLRFPYRFRKPHEMLEHEHDRHGDPDLKARIRANADGQHDAIVSWAVQGAVRTYTNSSAALALTSAVEADTDAWRAEADRILGYWRADQIIQDEQACVLSTDMLAMFNAWMFTNGHNKWAKETFAPKFGQHSETARHGVELRREKNPKGLVRPDPFDGPFSTGDAMPAQPWVWRGVRPITAADLQEHEEVSEVSNPSGNSLRDTSRGKVSEGVGNLGNQPGCQAKETGQSGHATSARSCVDCGNPHAQARPLDPTPLCLRCYSARVLKLRKDTTS